MPSVPRLNQPVQQVGLSKARAQDSTSLETFGGGRGTAQVFQALAQTANVVGDVLKEERMKADKIQVTQAYADAVKAKNQLLYDPKAGAINKRGQDAFGVMDEYMPQFEQKMGEIESRLADGDQKAMFREIRIKQQMDFDGDLQRHTFKEAQEFENETMKYGLEAAREDAVMNFQTPGKVGEAIAAQKGLIQNFAQSTGKSAEWLEMATREAESSTHKDILSRMLANGDDLMASTYMKTVKETLTADHLIQLEKAVEEGSLRGGSQRIVDGLIGKYGSYSAAMKEVKSMDLDPKLRDATQDRLRSEFAIKEQEKNKYLDNLERGAYDILDRTNGDINQIPPTQWTQFAGGTRSALKRYAEDRRAGVSAKTDIEKYYYLKELAENPDTRAKFQQFDLMKMKPYLSETDMKKFIDAQTEAKKGNSATLDGWRSDSMIVNQAFRDMKMNPKDDPDKYAQFSRKIEEMQMIEQERLGRKLNNTEMQKITDDLKVQVITDRSFFGMINTKKRVFELAGNEQVQVDIEDVPAKDRVEIEAALKKFGRPVTNENILKYFTQGMNRGN